MRVLFDSRPATTDRTGIGRYSQTMLEVAGGQLGAHWFLDGRDILHFATRVEESLALPTLLEREEIEAFQSPLFLLPDFLPCKSIVTLHDAIPSTHPELTTPQFRALWDEHAAVASTRAHAVICPTAASKNDLLGALQLDPERVHVVPETPHPVFLTAPSPTEVLHVRRRYGVEGAAFILVIGALVARKAPGVILEALRCRRDLPPAVFVGPPGDVDLHDEAERRGVSDRVHHLGVLPDSELVALLSAAELLAYPTFAEGFGLPVLEAFAAGTPVVASRVPAVAEVAGDAALLTPPGDAEAFGRAAARVISERSLAADLRSRGRARLDVYSTRAVREGLVQVYDHIEAATTAGRPCA